MQELLDLLILLAFVFFVAKWAIAKSLVALFGARRKSETEPQNKTVIKNYYQENHLHITPEVMNKMKGHERKQAT